MSRSRRQTRIRASRGENPHSWRPDALRSSLQRHYRVIINLRALMYRSAHASANKWALAVTSMSQLMKGELPSTAPTKGHLRLQSLAGWASVSLEKRSSLHGDGRSTHGASTSFWHLSGAVP